MDSPWYHWAREISARRWRAPSRKPEGREGDRQQLTMPWELSGISRIRMACCQRRSFPDITRTGASTPKRQLKPRSTHWPQAEIMGWTRDEAAFALLNLAADRVLTIDANQATDEAIARAVRMVIGEV